MNFEYETDRLVLRILDQNSVDMVLDFYNRNRERFEKVEPIIGENFYTADYMKTLLTFEYQQTLKLSLIRFWIFEKDNPNQIIGTICYHDVRRPVFDCCTVGYKMDKDFIQKGYCHEALEKGNALMFNELKLHRIEAFVMPSNLPSIHLLESLNFYRVGLVHDKVLLNGIWEDHYLYSLINQ